MWRTLKIKKTNIKSKYIFCLSICNQKDFERSKRIKKRKLKEKIDYMQKKKTKKIIFFSIWIK